MINKTYDLNFEKEKLEIIKWVATLKDDTSIERLRMLRKKNLKSDWWNEISEEERSAIDKGIEDVKAGRVKPHKEVQKLYAKWL
jgi:predicted transcriptional regulator